MKNLETISLALPLEPKILQTHSKWIAVDKPPQWLSTPSSRGLTETRPILGLWLQKKLGMRVYPIHRLDFEVSGIMLFALDPLTQKDFSQAWQSGFVKKCYQAISFGGHFQPGNKQVWEDSLAMGKKRAFSSSYGKKAITHAHCLNILHNHFWEWRLFPVTGRRHQLRVQLSMRGSPIVGDKLYGAPPILGPGIALRAISLELISNSHGNSSLRLEAPSLVFDRGTLTLTESTCSYD